MISARRKYQNKCKKCGLMFNPLYASKGFFCSQKCSVKKDSEHHAWKKDLTNYFSIHSYLKKYKKGKCIECGDEGMTHLANLHEKPHERNIENYKELCVKCHVAYDTTDNRTKQWLVNLSKSPSHCKRITTKKCKACPVEFTPRRKTSVYCSNKCSAQNRIVGKRERNVKGKFVSFK